MKNILVLPNPLKHRAVEVAGQLIRLLQRQGCIPVLEQNFALQSGEVSLGRKAEELWEEIDLVMVLGGDGSMLNAARRVYPRQIPLLGVNFGQLGFLTRVESNQLEEAISLLIKGDFQYEIRTMLEAEIVREGQSVPRLIGLNELVVSKSSLARMVRLETWIDNEYFTTYPADGLIVATATGSTAYSLSAGGPILDPRLNALLLTPICAHSLYARPMVLSEEARIKVVLNASHTAVTLTADGQTGVTLRSRDTIHFRKAEAATRLLRFNNQGVFEVLKSRLRKG